MPIPSSRCANKYSQKIYDAIESFKNNPEVTSKLEIPGNMAALKFEQIFHRPLEEFDIINYKTLGMSKVNRFKSELKWTARKIRKEKATSMFGRWAYTTQARTRYNPIGSELHGQFIKTTHYFKARNIRNGQSHFNILKNLQQFAVSAGFIENQAIRGKVGQSAWKRAIKKATDLENEIIRAQVDKGKNDPTAERRLEEAVAKQENFLMQKEGRVFKDFLELVEGPKGLKSLAKDIANEFGDASLLERTGDGKIKSKLKDKMDTQLNRLTDNPHMKEALKEYIIMMRQNHHSLGRGVQAYKKSIQLGLESAGRSTNEIDIIINKIDKLISPAEEIGYFPHYRYDLNTNFLDNLMPRLEALNVVTRETLVRDNIKVDEALADLNKYLDNSSYLLQRGKYREKNPTDQYSRNFPVIMKRYTDEVSRFNFIAHSNMYAREALSHVKTMWNKGADMDGYGRDVIKEILDLHESQTGSREVKHPEFDALQRTILNLEFIGKIGLNPRGAVRNLTQALLNFVQWTPAQVFRMKRWYKNEVGVEFEGEIEKMFENVGLKYEEATFLMETGQRSESYMGSKVKIDKNLELEFKNHGPFTGLSKITGKIASKFGKMHSMAENFNRRTTFKMAFYEAYKGFKYDGAFEKYFRNTYAASRKEKLDPKSVSQKIVHSEIMRRSRNFAIRMTTLLHFDYSDVSKSKIMKTQLGRLMLQFQHYGKEFYNYNLDIAKDAYHGRLNPKDPATWRAVRMGTIYGAVPMMLGMAFGNINLFGLIQHNTSERINQILQIFTGDEEEIQKAFFGKPPELSFFGGPFFNDLLTTGQVFRWWDFSDASLFKHGEQWESLARLEDDEKLFEIASILNPAIVRQLTQTIPIATSGKPFSAFQFELGLYPSADIRDAKEKYYNMFKDVPVMKQIFQGASAFGEWQTDIVEDYKAYTSSKYDRSSINSRFDYINDLYKAKRKRDKAFRTKHRKRF